jgi:RNA polymerase sigma-70 factor (ECF subfamily)
MPSLVERELKTKDVPEEDTIRLAQEGNASAFEQLYRRHSGHIYSICLRILKDAGEAEDLTQEAFLLSFRKIHTFRGEAKFFTGLHRLTTNLVLIRLRKKRHPEAQLDATHEPEEEDSRPVMELGRTDLRLSGMADHMNLIKAIE